MSHTVKLKVELRNKTALGYSVVELKGSVLGEGTHRLYQGNESGFGFTLPAWTYPLVLKTTGELLFDDFGGHWGNRSDIDRLMEHYTLHAAKFAADAQGWMSERTGAGLIIFHPNGGTLTIGTGGVIDAQNFVGSSCATATEAIEAALGTRKEQSLKNDFFVERARIDLQE